MPHIVSLVKPIDYTPLENVTAHFSGVMRERRTDGKLVTLSVGGHRRTPHGLWIDDLCYVWEGDLFDKQLLGQGMNLMDFTERMAVVR